MSKILSCWFWKPKTKSSSKTENKRIENSYVEPTEPITAKGDCKYRRIVESRMILPLYLSKADSLNQGTAYFKRVSVLKSQNKKVRSYPVSPRKVSLEGKLYVSDQNFCTMSKYNLHSSYSAGAPHNSSNNKPRATLGSSEPFPFQVPKDIAPRQSLFYELRYGDTDNSETAEKIEHEAEKPIEGYNIPNTSGGHNLSRTSTYKRELHNQQDNMENQDRKSSTRKTIIHVTPVSVKKPRESYKFQADSFVTASNKTLVRQLQFKPKNKTPLLINDEGKVLHPLQKDKVRSSVRSKIEIPPVRVSVVKPLEQEEYVSTIPLRRSFRRSSIRNSPVIYRDVEAEKLNRLSFLSEKEASPSYMENNEYLELFPEMPVRESIRKSAQRSERVGQDSDIESSSFPFARSENEPVVYAVPVVPTRGRSKSLLQQSVKSLTSKNLKEEPVVYRKNIRYSMDTDVFSAETRRRSVTPASPGFVNMERGQPMLVSEVLNPITSLFISDLKNPVPKDPLNKPKEANVWVKPRRYSVQRSSISKQPSKPVTRNQPIAYESPAPTTRTVPIQRRLSRKSRYKYKDESSSSDESIVIYKKKPKQSAPRRSYHHAVYAAQMPSLVIPQPECNRNSLYFPVNAEQIDVAQNSSSNDICGLNLGSDQRILKDLQSPYSRRSRCDVKMVSSTQQTDIEDDLDLICYPSESVLNKSVVSSESGSKLRWRIIIKRGEEK